MKNFRITRLLFLAVLLGMANACLPSDPSLSEIHIPEMPTGNISQIIKEENPIQLDEIDPISPPSPINPVPQAMQNSLETHCANRPAQERQTYKTTIADELIHIDGTLIFNKNGVSVEDLKTFVDQLKVARRWYPTIQAVFKNKKFVDVFTPEFLATYTLNVTPSMTIREPIPNVRNTSLPDPVVIHPDVQEATDEALGLREDETGQAEVNYTDVLIEKDQGDLIRPDSNVSNIQGLRAVNISGLLYVEPSTDGQVSWAARKWILAEKARSGNKAMQLDMKLFSLVHKNWDYVVADHPKNNRGSVPRSRYKVCMVLKAPPALIHSLKNDNGITESLDHPGPLVVENDSGDITIRKAGSNDVWLSSNSGKIKIIQNGTGDVFAQNESGTISVEADSKVAFRLLNKVGATTYILRNGGGPLQKEISIVSEAGAIQVFTDPGVGFLLNASVDIAASSGSIFLPVNGPRAEKVGLTAEKANGPIHGGNVRLALHTQAAPITVTFDQAPPLEVDRE